MNEAIRELADDSGVLGRVYGRRSPAGYEVLELIFDHGSLRLSRDGDTDEILADVSKQATSDLPEIHDDDALASIGGKVIELAWTMVNSRGYEDAFQLRCIDLATRSESCLQFEVGASVISVVRVSPHR